MQNIQILDSTGEISAAPATESILPSHQLDAVGRPPADLAVRPPLGHGTSVGDDLPPILVAEDDPDDSYFIERLIKKTGVKNRVKTFEDGTEVVNFLGQIRAASVDARHRKPLLLFLDLNMAGLDGFGFLEWARQHRELAPLTIVILSNSNEPDDVERAMALGAHRYLVKYPSVPTMTTIVHAVYPQTVF